MKILTLILLALCLYQAPIKAHVNDKEVEGEDLPKSWYLLPEEDMDVERGVLGSVFQKLNPNQERGIDRVLEANADAFDKMEDEYRLHPDAHPRGKKWKLSAIILDLGVSLAGTIGIVTVKGEASGALYWKKKAQRDSLTAVADTTPAISDDNADFTFESTDRYDDLEKRIEPLVRMVMATGNVKPEGEEAVRRGLKDTIFDYHTIVQYLGTINPDRKWYANKLRLDITIDITGKINPTTSVGGGVRLRFDWTLRPTRQGTVLVSNDHPRAEELRKIGDNLKKFIEDLANTMNTVKYDDLSETGFKMKSMRFGLGLFLSGKFGVVKVGGSVFGYIYFAQKTDYRMAADVNPGPLPEIPIIDYTADKKLMHFADEHKIPYQVHQDRDGRKAVVYQSLGENFRKGLEKCVKIGGKIAERASKHERKWQVYQLKTGFALSISGGFAIVTIGGTGELELTFVK